MLLREFDDDTPVEPMIRIFDLVMRRVERQVKQNVKSQQTVKTMLFTGMYFIFGTRILFYRAMCIDTQSTTLRGGVVRIYERYVLYCRRGNDNNNPRQTHASNRNKKNLTRGMKDRRNARVHVVLYIHNTVTERASSIIRVGVKRIRPVPGGAHIHRSRVVAVRPRKRLNFY